MFQINCSICKNWEELRMKGANAGFAPSKRVVCSERTVCEVRGGDHYGGGSMSCDRKVAKLQIAFVFLGVLG